MNAGFAALLADWAGFFTAVSGVSATLVGLLFVALGLNPSLMADDGPAGMRVWAAQTFHSFLVVLVVSLIALIPDETRSVLTTTLLIVGVQGLIRVALDARQARQDPDPAWGSHRAMLRFLSPLIAYLTALWLAWQLWLGNTDSLGWIVMIIFFLVMNAAANCWDLLKAIGDRHRTAGQP